MTVPRPFQGREPGRHPEADERPVTYRLGLPTGSRAAAAELYWDAFGKQVAPALGPRGRGTAVLARALRLECAVTALAAGDLVGLAGFHLGGASFAEIRLRHLAAELGWAGVLRWPLLAPLARRPRDGELLDGFVVRADWRGRGIGTSLLHAIFALARANGLGTVRLDVVDTTPARGAPTSARGSSRRPRGGRRTLGGCSAPRPARRWSRGSAAGPTTQVGRTATRRRQRTVGSAPMRASARGTTVGRAAASVGANSSLAKRHECSFDVS